MAKISARDTDKEIVTQRSLREHRRPSLLWGLLLWAHRYWPRWRVGAALQQSALCVFFDTLTALSWMTVPTTRHKASCITWACLASPSWSALSGAWGEASACSVFETSNPRSCSYSCHWVLWPTCCFFVCASLDCFLISTPYLLCL